MKHDVDRQVRVEFGLMAPGFFRASADARVAALAIVAFIEIDDFRCEVALDPVGNDRHYEAIKLHEQLGRPSTDLDKDQRLLIQHEFIRLVFPWQICDRAGVPVVIDVESYEEVTPLETQELKQRLLEERTSAS